jgi:uncharacterized membrane protein YgcG
MPFDISVSLDYLQQAAAQLLEAFDGVYRLFVDTPDLFSSLGGMQAAATHLMVAGMRHVSVMFQQDVNDFYSASVSAKKLAKSTVLAIISLTTAVGRHREYLSHALLATCPHFVVWSDMSLLLTTYAHILHQQQQLPAANGMSGSSAGSGRTGAAAAPAAQAPGASSSSSSSSSGSDSKGSSGSSSSGSDSKGSSGSSTVGGPHQMPTSHRTASFCQQHGDKLTTCVAAYLPATSSCCSCWGSAHRQQCGW